MAICSVQYHYDPLDRLATSTQASESPCWRFYQNQRLATEVHVDGSNSVFQHADQLLAQRINASTQLLATDFQRSVLSADQHTRQCYSPYGQRSIFSGVGSLLGFNGERPDPLTGHYLLGNGYRAYNPVLMRFNSPDRLSPFGGGGINAYAYCSGDPLNREDSTGYMWKFVLSVLMLPTGGRTSPVSRSNQSIASTLIPAVLTPVALSTQAGRAMRPLPDGPVMDGLPLAIVDPVPRPTTVAVSRTGQHLLRRQAHVVQRPQVRQRQVATNVDQSSGGSSGSTSSSSSRDSTPPISREPSPSNLRPHPQLRRTDVRVDITDTTTGVRSVRYIRNPNAGP